MELTTRGLWTMMHGMGFGALYLMACSGALVELIRSYSPAPEPVSERGAVFLRIYLMGMALLAWATVLSGTYILYPWYRAVAPAGAANLAAFPQRLLLASLATAGWHELGMEWKEHVAWFVPIAITMAAAIVARYGMRLRAHPQLRAAVLAFTLVSFFAAGVAGFFGAMLNKRAPVEGGGVIHLRGGD